MRRLWWLAGLAVLVGCMRNTRPENPGGLDGQTVELLIETAARVRRLPLKEKVEWKILPEDAPAPVARAVAAALPDDIRAPPTAAAPEDEGDSYRQKVSLLQEAMGLLDATWSAAAESDAFVRDQLYGWYDPETRKLFVIDKDLRKVMPGVTPQVQHTLFKGTIIHEGAHAAQDQHFGLTQLLAGATTLDATLARRALVEGDATLVMMDALREQEGAEPMRGELAVQEAMALGMDHLLPTMRHLSVGMQDVLLVSYDDGAAFCAALRRVGGTSLLNAAYKNPPSSVSHILHPRLYVEGILPDVIPPLPLDALTGAGHSVRLQETAGELFCNAYVGDAQRQTCLGWRGDRLAILTRAGVRTPSLVWVISWEDEASAQRFANAVEERRGTPCTSEVRCDAGIPVFIHVDGNRTVLMRNLSPAQEETLLPELRALAITRPEPRPLRAVRWTDDEPIEQFLDLMGRSLRLPPDVASGQLTLPGVGLRVRNLPGTWTPEKNPRRPFVAMLRSEKGAIVGVTLNPTSPYTPAATMAGLFAGGFANGMKGEVVERRALPTEGKSTVYLSRVEAEGRAPATLLTMVRHGWVVGVMAIDGEQMDEDEVEQFREALARVEVLPLRGEP